MNNHVDSVDEFTNIEDLKNHYKVLKLQRDNYKNLLSNYEKIFLKEANTKTQPHLPTSEFSLQNDDKLSRNNSNFNGYQGSTYTFQEKEEENVKSPSFDNDEILSMKNFGGYSSKEKDINNDISDKIDRLNKEISDLKYAFDWDNGNNHSDYVKFTESLNKLRDLNKKSEGFRRDSEHLSKFSEDFLIKNMNSLKNKEDSSSNGLLSISGMSMRKNASNSDKNNNEISKSKPNISLENNIQPNRERSYSSIVETHKQDKLVECDYKESLDSTADIQFFFNNIAIKFKTLEERNIYLNNQLENGLKEKENLLNNINYLEQEVNSLKAAKQEKNEEKFKNEAEIFLEQQEKRINQKHNMCKNLCTLI